MVAATGTIAMAMMVIVVVVVVVAAVVTRWSGGRPVARAPSGLGLPGKYGPWATTRTGHCTNRESCTCRTCTSTTSTCTTVVIPNRKSSSTTIARVTYSDVIAMPSRSGDRPTSTAI